MWITSSIFYTSVCKYIATDKYMCILASGQNIYCLKPYFRDCNIASVNRHVSLFFLLNKSSHYRITLKTIWYRSTVFFFFQLSPLFFYSRWEWRGGAEMSWSDQRYGENIGRTITEILLIDFQERIIIYQVLVCLCLGTYVTCGQYSHVGGIRSVWKVKWGPYEGCYR